MKKISYYASMAALMLFASCSSDVEDFVDENKISDGETITIGVSMPGAEGTRVSTDDLQGLVWEAKDRICATGYDADGKYYGYQMFDIDANYTGGSATAKFTGKLVQGAVKHDFLYTGENHTYYVDAEGVLEKCDYTTQVQNGMNSSSHVKSYIRMMSDVTDTYNNIVLKPYNSILKINLKSLPKEIAYSARMSIKYFVNYGDADEHQNAEIQLKGAMTSGKDNFVYMAFDPAAANDLQAGKKLGLEFITKDYTCKASITSVNGKDYLEGKIYTVSVDYDVKDNWTWEVSKNEVLNVLYSNPLNTQELVNEWTLEGNVANLISFSENSMLMSADVWGYFFDAGIGYAVSPKIQLGKTKNQVTFDHKYIGMSGGPEKWATLVIRAVGSSEWTPLPIVKYPSASGSDMISSDNIVIPDDFKGLEVQIAFMNKISYEASSYSWFINNFMVKGI